MARQSNRYFEGVIKGRSYAYQVSAIKYRDKKGRFAKFDTRRKLKVEVYAKSEKVDKATSQLVWHERRIKKWSLGYAKRKKPVTKEYIEARIKKRAKQSKGNLIEKIYNGMKVWVYKTPEKKKQPHKVKIPFWMIKAQNIEKALDEYSQTQEN